MPSDKTPKPKEASALVIALSNAFAGAFGGMISMATIYPLDIVRAEMQAQASTNSRRLSTRPKGNGMAVERKDDDEGFDLDDEIEEDDERIRGFQETVSMIYERDGFGGFYRALNSQLGGMFFSNLVYFFWTSFFKYKLYSKRDVSVSQNLLVAVLAGVITVFTTNPFWAAQTQLQLQRRTDSKQYDGVVDAMQQIFQKHGLAGLYAGLIPSLILVSNPVIVYVVYERVVSILKAARKTNSLSNQAYALCGAIAKAVATVLTYPIQILKTQLQKKDSPFANGFEAFWFAMACLKARNVAPLFTGMSAKLYQTVSNSAIQYMVYERLLELIKYMLTILLVN